MNYQNNTEYRQCLRTFFQMNSKNYPSVVETYGQSWDPETIDEMSYDESAASKTLDHIYEKTKDNVLFQNIYSNAAARMFSQDPEIGLALLLSYDYLKLFYTCITLFFNSPDELLETSEPYVSLMKKIS